LGKNSTNANSARNNVLYPKIQPEGNYITVRIGKNTIDAMVDTGAVRSLISHQAAKSLKLKIEPLTQLESEPLVSANGSNLELVGCTTPELYFKGLKIEHTLVVAKELSPSFLIGVDFLSTYGARIDYGIKPPKFTLFDGLIELPLFSRCDETNCVTVDRTICIPAFNEAYLAVNTPYEFNDQDVFLEQSPCVSSVMIAKALAFCKNNKTICRVLNHNPYVVTLRRGMKLAKILGLESAAAIVPCTPLRSAETAPVINVSRAELDAFHKEYGFQLCSELGENRRYQVLELLFRYKSVFARNITEIKQCKGEPLKLDLHSNRKMFKRQYRLSEPDKKEMGRQIKQMEDSGIIERSTSPYYNSPTYLVLKKNGQKRMVVDLRGINSLIIPKLVQLPQIEELLETVTMTKPRWLSAFDILSAFFQVGLAPESRDLTSFTSPQGLRFRYTRAPMGLSSSPSQLNLILSNIFCDRARFHSLIVYVDDILVYSATWESHLQQLELALSTLQENDISCNPNKTEIGFSQIEYLGYRLSSESIRLSEKHIEAINKMQPPKNVKALQRQLGMLNYFKKFCPRFSANTYHMRQLLKKGVEFNWTPQCQAEHDYLKKCLVSDPILKPIDTNRDLVITCDGSQTGLGFAILQADDDGLLHVVRYGSYATTPAQANYNSEDLEAVALMYALKSIEWLAQCRHVTVITDNTAVLHIADWSPRNRRQRRMLTYIMQFSMTLLFVRGRHNFLPDALSRMFQDASVQERRDNEPKFVHEIDDFILPVTTRSSTRAPLNAQQSSQVRPTGFTGDMPGALSEPIEQRMQDGALSDPTAPSTQDGAPSEHTEPRTHDGAQIVNYPSSTALDGEMTPGVGNTEISDPHIATDGMADQLVIDSPAALDSNQMLTEDNDNLPVVFPRIEPKDYEVDDEFSDMYKYLQFEELTDNVRRDKTTMIMADRYMIDTDGLLYKMDLPRQKNLARLKPITKRLCVPRRFRHDMIAFVHNQYGHYSVQQLFHTLAARYYWKSMFVDASEFSRTCDICQRTKINYGHKYAPLHTLPVPDQVGVRFSMDHKNLTRTTALGNTAVLVIVECFTGFPHLIPVQDMSAETTARAIVQHIIPFWGVDFCLQSDKAASFLSALFAHVSALLGIRHITSAARTARSNGMAEALVKRLSEHLKFYANQIDDYKIEQALPLIETIIRATPHSKTLISPYELVFGRPMRLGVPGDPVAAQSTLPDISPDRVAYYKWLSTELRRLHDAAKAVREDVKLDDKVRYDRTHKVVPPVWQVGDRVLLQDSQVKSGASRILTKPRFVGPYLIKNIVVGRPNIGQSYQLLDEKSGKTLRNLVSNDRMKRYDVDRQKFNKRLPRLQTVPNVQEPTSVGEPGPTAVRQRSVRQQDVKPIEILSQKLVGGKKRYMVRYTDGKTYECDWVSPALFAHYKTKQRANSL